MLLQLWFIHNILVNSNKIKCLFTSFILITKEPAISEACSVLGIVYLWHKYIELFQYSSHLDTRIEPRQGSITRRTPAGAGIHFNTYLILVPPTRAIQNIFIYFTFYNIHNLTHIVYLIVYLNVYLAPIKII